MYMPIPELIHNNIMRILFIAQCQCIASMIGGMQQLLNSGDMVEVLVEKVVFLCMFM